jgi:transcriptional regulator with XRE-family HTH domain
MPKSLRSERHKELLQLLILQRKEAGLTQTALAEKLEKPQSYVAKFENGERRLDVLEYLDIAEAVGFDPGKFLRQLIKRR